MGYGMGISFPTAPTKQDINTLRRQVAHDSFAVVGEPEAETQAEIEQPRGEVAALVDLAERRARKKPNSGKV